MRRLKQWLLGAPKNPFDPQAHHHIALVAFLAWVGLGADGLSSSCYGPEEAFKALGHYHHLAIFVALATAITVFILAFAYNQVIELFPSGGGGYKVASMLLGKSAGVVAGAALLIDYVLTIAISVASGVDAAFSMLPISWQGQKLPVEIVLIIALTLLNLRGMKESIKILMPIFMSFVVSHLILIIWGIFSHKQGLQAILPQGLRETHELAQNIGWAGLLALLLRAYSYGSGTYTGLEAISNNVQNLAEPRVRTGKWTMMYLAISLSVMAAGIMLLYLLWEVTPQEGMTLNAVVFQNILGHSVAGAVILKLVLMTEMGILLVASNTGFLAGPAVLANMAVDKWVPRRFSQLSNRLVTQNGIVLFGLFAALILIWSHGQVSLLVVLYSINVFLTISLSLLGMCRYWWVMRSKKTWLYRLLFTAIALSVALSILSSTVYSKFHDGAWVTLLITGILVAVCVFIRRHYLNIEHKLNTISLQLLFPLHDKTKIKPLKTDPHQPTAVILVDHNFGVSMHTLLWTLRLFPNHFKNVVLLSVGSVDIESFAGEQALKEMEDKTSEMLQYFMDFCQQHHIASKTFSAFGADNVDLILKLTDQITDEFPNCIFFAGRLVFEHENWFTQWLHSSTSLVLQRKLHLQGKQLIIMPMKIN